MTFFHPVKRIYYVDSRKYIHFLYPIPILYQLRSTLNNLMFVASSNWHAWPLSVIIEFDIRELHCIMGRIDGQLYQKPRLSIVVHCAKNTQYLIALDLGLFTSIALLSDWLRGKWYIKSKSLKLIHGVKILNRITYCCRKKRNMYTTYICRIGSGNFTY